jgi:hypothetical protein
MHEGSNSGPLMLSMLAIGLSVVVCVFNLNHLLLICKVVPRVIHTVPQFVLTTPLSPSCMYVYRYVYVDYV